MKNKLCVLAGIVLLLAVMTCENTTSGTGSVSYSIAGTVDVISGDSPDGAAIRLKQSGVNVGSAVADGDGSFDIRGVAAGNYTIEVTLGEYTGSSDGVIKVTRNISGITLTLIPEEDALIFQQDQYGNGDSPDAVSGASDTVSESLPEDDDSEPDAVSGASYYDEFQIPATVKVQNFAEIKTKPSGAYLVEWTVNGTSRPWDMSGFNTPVTIVIDGKGKYVSLEGGYNGKGSLLTVPDGVTVVLKNITFYGCDTNTKAIVTVESGGTLVMKDGAKISGARRSPVDGGAVKVKSGGIFQMDGGEISDNTGVSNGGAVFVSGGQFIMRGGKISGNQASNVGGVFLYKGGNFVMTGGEISGNTSKNYAGGVLVNGGQFTMTGGEIKDNKCHLYGGGVFIGYYSHLSGSTSGVFIQNGGKISGNRSAGGGGGVSLRGSSTLFILNGGEISGNLAVPDDSIDPYGGGGVFVQDGGLFEFKSGSIVNNITRYELWGGGGILAASKDGGGGSAGVDAVSGASGGGGSLGAASSGQDPNMAVSGGVISGNTVGNGKGAGIYAESGNFSLYGSPTISDRVCVQYQPLADRHILINGGFTGTTVALDLRGNQNGISFIGNWIKPVLAMASGGAIPASVTSRFALGTFAPYSGSPVSNISGYKINEAGKVVKK